MNTNTNTELFPKVVGQNVAKRRLAFYLKNYRASQIMPHLMFIAPKGCGKTMMAKAMGSKMMEKDGEKAKRFLEINCSSIKNLKQFVNQILVPHVHGKECTILLDEASELPKDVEMALLTMINPNDENRTTFSYEDYVIDFNFRRQSFMFATTEAHSIFHALMDRCERVDLEEYSYDELGEIVGRICEGKTFEDGLLPEIATVLRGNARAAQKMSTHITSYLASVSREHFSMKDWKFLSFSLGIIPLGLSRIELQILRLLEEKKECSLTLLASKTGLTRACLQQDFEMFLQKNNLMEIGRGGRELTKVGQDYLKNIDKYLEDIKTAARLVKVTDDDLTTPIPRSRGRITVPTRVVLPTGTEVATT